MAADQLLGDRAQRVGDRESPASASICARNTPSNSRSPISPRSACVIAAIDRVEHLVGLLEHEPRSDSIVCSRSHGQPSGPRSRAMMSTSLWNSRPATPPDACAVPRSSRGVLLCEAVRAAGVRARVGHAATMLAFERGNAGVRHHLQRLHPVARDDGRRALRRHRRSEHRRAGRAEPRRRQRR